MVGMGVLSALLLETLLGGFGPTGASTNGGWFALIVALMCLPFGGLLLAAEPVDRAAAIVIFRSNQKSWCSSTNVAMDWAARAACAASVEEVSAASVLARSFATTSQLSLLG